MSASAAKVNPGHELMCCLRCGRDTRSVYGVCGHCGGTSVREKDKQQDRSKEPSPWQENAIRQLEDSSTER